MTTLSYYDTKPVWLVDLWEGRWTKHGASDLFKQQLLQFMNGLYLSLLAKSSKIQYDYSNQTLICD